jgi:hypothetical protein
VLTCYRCVKLFLSYVKLCIGGLWQIADSWAIYFEGYYLTAFQIKKELHGFYILRLLFIIHSVWTDKFHWKTCWHNVTVWWVVCLGDWRVGEGKRNTENKRHRGISQSHAQCILPLVTASSAQPDPEAPPPTIRTSKLSVWRDLICSSLDGSCLLACLSFGAVAACTCST